MLPQSEMLSQFNEDVPGLFQQGLVKLVYDCCADTDKVGPTYGFQGPLASWNAPYFRRTHLSSQVLELTKRYPSLRGEIRHTRKGGNPYAEITAGRFIITVSKVDDPGELPRDADHRTTNSKVNYNLFQSEQDESAPINAILTYVPHLTEPRPKHIQFVIPDGDYSCILYSIPMLGGIAAQSEQPTVAETFVADPQPKLRARTKEEKATS